MKAKRFSRFFRAAALALCGLFAFAGCATGGTDDKDPDTPPGGGTQLQYDTRGLTPQQYSVANLTAVDDYGRTVTVADPTNAEKRYVGVFYFAWLGSQGMTGIYDVNKLEQLGDDSPLYDTNDTTGQSPTHQFHFASEPLYGYYTMKDPWVVARHVELLTMANIDYILFDYTNNTYYNDVARLVLETLRTYAAQGWDVPKVGFYTNTNSREVVMNLYTTFYAPGAYDDLWFRFEGDNRPVIVGISTANGGATDQTNPAFAISTDSDVYQYFNFYESQWPSTGVSNDEKGFPWMQWGSPIPNLNGNASVSVAQHSLASVYFSDQRPNSSRGYDGQGNVNEDWRQGSNFQWQWDTALKYADAGMVKNIFVTGWNEWTAIKYVTGDGLGGGNNTSGYTGKDVWFVDDYDAEYSRDIEMGKEYGDGFYIQLVSNTRTFKMNESSKYKMATKTISDLSDLSAWKNVFVEYADFAGDAMARDGSNAANVAHVYQDNTNRNDIVKLKVIHDDTNVYFYVETAEDITAHEEGDTRWMNLLISAGDTSTSFAGFNYIINRTPNENGTTSVEKCTESGFHWAAAGEAEYYVSGNVIVYKVPLSVLGLSADNVEFSFKVADNVQKPSYYTEEDEEESILYYYITGDSAPIGRFGYAYGK